MNYSYLTMNLCVNLVLVLLYNFLTVTTTIADKSQGRSIIDTILENLELLKIDDPECYSAILELFKTDQNISLAATWVLDSMQLPSGVLYGSQYSLGNYDECMNADLRTRYCLVDVKLTNEVVNKRALRDNEISVKDYLGTLTKHRRRLNTISMGVCLPASCSQTSVRKFTKALFRSSTLGKIFPEPQIVVDHCQVSGETKEWGLGVHIFLYLIILLLIIAVMSTWYIASWEPGDSLCKELATCFCMKINAFDLVKASPGEVPALHGMRAMTAIIFVFSHQIFFVISGAVGNGLDVDKFIDDGFFLMHTDLMTDTFLLMSGLLLARGLIAKDKLENPLMVLWKRYIRLICPMALIVWYIATVSMYAGDGPLWPRLAGLEHEMCRKNWWLSLLMANNYVNSEEMCFITLWYIPADFQLTILGLFLIYLGRYNSRLGKAAIGVVALLSVVLPAYTTFVNKLPGTILYNVETMINIRQNEVFNSTYIQSHYRIGSYFVGLCVGYVMTVYKPNLHRKTVSKKTSIFLFPLLFIMAWIPWVIGGLLYTREYDVTEAAIFASLHRIVWALTLSALVLICEYGDLPVVSDLLSWQAWVTLSRLSYGLYLIHPVIIQHIAFSTRAPLRFHLFTMLSDSFGLVVVGYLLSLLMWLLVQAPVSNLASLLHSRRKSTRPQSEFIKTVDSDKKTI